MRALIPSQRSLSRAFRRELPKYFVVDEVQRIVSDELKQKNFKSYVFILFLWCTGMRESEALSLKVSDIDLRNQTVKVKTMKRRNHIRVIPLPQILTGEIAVFINENGLKRDDKLFQFNRKTGYNLIHKACRVAGLDDERAHPHTFRHSYAINCLTQGVPVTAVRDLLGHRDILSTLVYTQILAYDVKVFLQNVRF